MELTPLWTLAPIAASIVLGLVLFTLSRRYAWKDSTISEEISIVEETSKTSVAGNDLKTQLRVFFDAHRREILLTGAALGVLIFAMLSAPVQMTGEISPIPNEPGRPFYFIHWQRNHLIYFYHETASVSNMLTGLLALALTVFAAIHRSPQMIRAGLLWSFLALAGSAQWMISSKIQFSTGTVLYLLAGAGLLLWGWLNRSQLETELEKQNPLPVWQEALLIFAVIALASFGRLYALDRIPYGIEGDEAKWTAEVVWLGIRGEPDTNGLYHRDALPVSFFMQTVFHRLMGPSLFAARFEVAFFSIIATLILYLFLRQVTTTPLALLSAWLVSASIFDISASRLANVESHVKLWPILALALLAWALQKKHWTYFAIAGIALTLGLLTYDTVWPLGLVMLVIFITEAIRSKETLRDAIRNVSAMLAPVLISMPFILPYLTSRMSYYEIDSKGWESGVATLWSHFTDVIMSWYFTVNSDFIYNRDGPLLNAFLLPWMTFGLVTAFVTQRKQLSFWTLTWVLLFIIPVPIMAHSPLGRVYYPGLAAVYILTAIGLFAFYRESLRALGVNFKPLLTAVTAAVLFWLPLFNLYIYFNEVNDFDDRQMRREIAEMAREVASEDNLIVLASIPRANEALNNEYQMIELFMMEKLPIEQVKMSYKYVALEEVMPHLTDMSERPNRSIIFDKRTMLERQQRDDLQNAVRMCYPKAVWTEGMYFDRADIAADILANPVCTSTTLSFKQEAPSVFSWELSHGTTERVVLACEILQIDRNWLDAENFNAAPGWQAETNFATGWNGDGFLMDNFGSLPTEFDVQVTEDKPIYLWVRYYKRNVDDYPSLITLNGQTISFDALGERNLNQWVWEKLGPFRAPIGLNVASLSRPYTGDPQQFIAIFIDTIVTSNDPNFTPSDDHFIELPLKTYTFANKLSNGSISLQMEPGTYRCAAEAVSRAEGLVDAFGKTPVRSNLLEFKIDP